MLHAGEVVNVMAPVKRRQKPPMEEQVSPIHRLCLCLSLVLFFYTSCFHLFEKAGSSKSAPHRLSCVPHPPCLRPRALRPPPSPPFPSRPIIMAVAAASPAFDGTPASSPLLSSLFRPRDGALPVIDPRPRPSLPFPTKSNGPNESRRRAAGAPRASRWMRVVRSDNTMQIRRRPAIWGIKREIGRPF